MSTPAKTIYVCEDQIFTRRYTWTLIGQQMLILFLLTAVWSAFVVRNAYRAEKELEEFESQLEKKK